MDEEKRQELMFPYKVVREPQKELLEKVDKCILGRRNLIVHAPTGIGKTISTIGPALKHALKKNLKIMFLTSRHTQHLIALETIKLIKDTFDIQFHTSDIVGKRHMCIQPGASVLYPSEFFEYCKNARENGKCEFYTKCRKTPSTLHPEAEKLVSDIEIMSDQGAERIKEVCEINKMCPYEIAIEMAKEAKIIVCDYNYAFDPGVSMSLFGKAKIDLNNCVLIVDEGHNLPDRARNIYTSRLTNVMLKRAIKEAKKFGYNEAVEILVGIQDILLDASDSLGPGQERKVSLGEFYSKVSKLRSFEVLTDELEEIADAVRESQRQSYIGSVNTFLKQWNGDEDGFVRYIAKQHMKNELLITLCYRCLDPSILTKDIIKEAHSTILMSGTLTPTEMYRELLGFPADITDEVILESPFPEKNKLSLVIPKTTTQYKRRSEDMFKAIAENCAKIVNAVPGNSAIFFPSYDMLSKVYNYLFSMLEKTVFRESSDLTKQDREEMLERFAGYQKTGAVLLGVASGSFGEGIDFPGDILKAVVVVGLPLQRPDLETKELIAYYDHKFGKGWDYAYVAPAFSKTLQNAGRCIRSETDKGIVVFLDERFTWPNYFKYFPPDGEIKIAVEYEGLVKDFFS